MKQAVTIVGLLIVAVIVVLIWINMDSSDTDPSQNDPYETNLSGGGSGKVKLMTSGAEVTLQANGFQSSKIVYLFGSGSEQDVEAGNYRINKVVLRRDSDNSIWTMEARNRTGAGKNVEVKPAQTTELEIGPPLTVQTDVRQRDGTVQVGLGITGIAGESYLPYAKKDGRRLPAPKVNIVDEKGAILTSSKFEYG